MRLHYLSTLLLVVAAFLSACSPSARIADERVEALPPVPSVDGPLDIDLVYPREGALKPSADSTFLFGSVGTGEAELTINGSRVPVAPNGGFLAFVPVPQDGIYTLSARSDGVRDTFVFSYAKPPEPAAEDFDQATVAVVTGGRDTLATGSHVVDAAPAPGADRKWFFPPGTRFQASGRLGSLVRVRLTPDTDAWLDSSDVRLLHPTENDRDSRVRADVSQAAFGRSVDITIAGQRPPFLIIPNVRMVDVVLYGQIDAGKVFAPSDFIEDVSWSSVAADSAVLHVELSQPLWGYKAFFDDEGSLVLRLRRPPEIRPSNPLDGVRILVDPGHPPGGAIGPTGFTEAEANLAVSLKLAAMLRERGAEVVMTRTGPSGLVSDSLTAIELWARVDLAVAKDADLLVSVHNNAFPDGVNPFLNYGTETYFYHPFAEPLAEALQRHIAAITGLPSLGAKRRSLALVRPSWMPAALTESLFMMFPQQEAALRDADFQERLARAHLEGIEAFLSMAAPE